MSLEPLIEGIGSEIDLPGLGKTTPQQVTPQQANPTIVHVGGVGIPWDGVAKFIIGRFQQGNPSGGISKDQQYVNDSIVNSITAIVEAEADFHEVAYAWIYTLSLQLKYVLSLMDLAQTEISTYVNDFIIPVLTTTNTEVRNLGIKEALDILQEIEQRQLGDLASQLNVQTWTRENIFDPLQLQQLQETAQRQLGDTLTQLDAHAYADQNGLKIAENVFAALAPVAALATSAANWIAECGQPMCDQMGPKTNLGNLLKDLEGLLGLLAGVALGTVTEHELESWAAMFGQFTGTLGEDFLGSFVEGGATLGDAAGAIVGDLENVGSAIFADLGISL